MLAVFDKSVAKSPEALQNAQSESVSALKDGFLAHHFSSVKPGSVTINLGAAGVLAYSMDKQSPFLPRYFLILFALFLICSSSVCVCVCFVGFIWNSNEFCSFDIYYYHL